MAKLLSGTRIYGTGTIDTQLIVSGSTATGSTTTGALIVAGGAGFGGGMYVGGIITATNIRITGSTIVLGGSAAANGPGTNAIAIGQSAAVVSSGNFSVVIGASAASNGAGANSVVVGANAASGGAQGANAVAIGNYTANQNQGIGAVAIGQFAGGNQQGNYSIAIGFNGNVSGTTNDGRINTNSIVLNASGAIFTGSGISSFYVLPIRGDATTSATTYSLYYNPVTKEITTATVGLATTATFARNIIGGTVGSLLVQTATNSTGFVTPVNTSGYVLQSVASAAPRWADLTPQVLNDISNQFDGSRVVFDLRVDQTSINTTVDSKDVEVVINGLRLTPYVDTFTYPWLTPYDSFKGFRVVAGKLILYNAPYRGDSSYVMLRPGSTARQKRRYPFAATTVALGD
jgi:hypothetical protein